MVVSSSMLPSISISSAGMQINYFVEHHTIREGSIPHYVLCDPLSGGSAVLTVFRISQPFATCGS